MPRSLQNRRRASNRPPFIIAMKVMAFDQATKITGYAVINDGVLVNHGVLTVKSSEDIMNRIYHMVDQIIDLIVAEEPDVLYFEGVEGVQNERTMIYLANLQGACLACSRMRGYVGNTIDVATWRHTMRFQMGRGVKREDLKAQAVKCVADIYGIECCDDEAEAICIALAVWKINFESKE